MADKKVVAQGTFIAVLIISIIIILIVGGLAAYFAFQWRRDRGELQNNICPVVN